jgi:hypothetical protein
MSPSPFCITSSDILDHPRTSSDFGVSVSPDSSCAVLGGGCIDSKIGIIENDEKQQKEKKKKGARSKKRTASTSVGR